MGWNWEVWFIRSITVSFLAMELPSVCAYVLLNTIPLEWNMAVSSCCSCIQKLPNYHNFRLTLGPSVFRSVCLYVWVQNFNLASNIWAIQDILFIFGMHILWVKHFHMILASVWITLWHWPLPCDPIWSSKSLMFHKHILYDNKTYSHSYLYTAVILTSNGHEIIPWFCLIIC